MGRLTADQVTRESGKAAGDVTSLNLSHRALTEVSCLSSFRVLERLDLGFNCLVTLESLSSCINLKWLSVVENKLESLKGIEGLSKLRVLNAGKNKLRSMDEVKSLTSLHAVILNDNNIYSIPKLDELQHLNTLVLSKNPIIDIADSLAKVKTIRKVSLSHCEIQEIGSSLTTCVELKELRLAHNKIAVIPPELTKNARLQNLDLGNNLIESWSDLKILSALHNLRNLNLQGNPLAEKDNLAKKVKKFVPTVRILNGKPIETSSKGDAFSQKEARKQIEEDHAFLKSSEFDEPKEVKRKKSKENAKNSAEHVVQSSSAKDTHSPVKRKNDKSSLDVVQSSGAKDIAHSPVKRKNDKSSLGDTDQKSKKEKRRKKFVEDEEQKAVGIDDTETPFSELIFSERDTEEANVQKKSEAVPDAKSVGELVIDHGKKKRSKGTVVGPSALELLSTAPDVGAGGASTWD